MNLVLPGMGIAERIDEERGQWFTPPDIAWRMACLAGQPPSNWRVLEPSAGSGNLVDAALRRAPFGEVTAHELDSYYAAQLRERFARELVDVVEGNYLDAPAPFAPYDLAIMNPPFEDGLDGEFLAKAMRESLRVIALVRLVALAGKGRHADVWSRVGGDAGWRLLGLHVFSARPAFQAGRAIGDRENGGSAKADFCVVRLTRVPGETGGTDVTWW